jgi:hypothetical protein
MPAPWNESCPGEHLSFGSFAIPLAQNLSHRSHVIPLGFTPWNSFSACLLVKNDRIGGDRLDLVNQGGVIPLGLYALCSLPYALCSMLYALSLCPMLAALLLPFPLYSLLSALCPMLHALCALRYALCPLPSVISHLPSALCAMRHACYSTGVQSFSGQLFHKAPPTQC